MSNINYKYKVNEYTPNNLILPSKNFKLFLGGTIDNGNSVNWQEEFIKRLKNDYDEFILHSNTYYEYANNLIIDIYNPRKKEWDSNIINRYYDRFFNYQVSWELKALETSDIVLINILKDSDSPISLLELGLYANSNKLIVVCPNEYKRSGSVHIVCQKYNIPLYYNINDLFINKNNTVTKFN